MKKFIKIFMAVVLCGAFIAAKPAEAKADTSTQAVYVMSNGATVLTGIDNPLYYQTGPFYLRTATAEEAYALMAYYQQAYGTMPGANPYIWINPYVYTNYATYAPVMPACNLSVNVTPTVPYSVYYNVNPGYNIYPYGYWY